MNKYPNKLVDSVRKQIDWVKIFVWFVAIPAFSIGFWYIVYKVITLLF